MRTSNPIYDYHFSWTIENFTLTPNMLRGPPVSPIPGYPVKLCLELQYKLHEESTRCKVSLVVSLIDLNAVDSHLVVSGITSIRNIRAITDSTEIGGGIPLLRFTAYHDSGSGKKGLLSHEMNLWDDKVVVEGKLSISCYNIASTVSSLKGGPEACAELLKDFKIMYESGSSSDVTFYIGEKTLPAHKNILRSRSPVFNKMFEESNSSKVLIEDTDFHVFNCFLNFLYTGRVEDEHCGDWESLLVLYSLAHKYQVKSLLVVCSGILDTQLSIETVCSVLLLADSHKYKELKDVAKHFIRCHFFEVIRSTEWEELILPKPQLLKELLASLNRQTAMK